MVIVKYCLPLWNNQKDMNTDNTVSTISAYRAATQSMGLPSWWINGHAVALYGTQWVISDDQDYCPVLVDGIPKLMCLFSDIDSDGRVYSYSFHDEVQNATWGVEVKHSDYLVVANHISNSEPF